MPYPNEHAARLQQPSRFNPRTFRRTRDGIIYGTVKVPVTVSVIWGKIKGRDKAADKPIPQALRFPTKNWTADAAKKWLSDHKIKYISFEPASGSKSQIEQPERLAQTIGQVVADLESEVWAMQAEEHERLITSIKSQTTAPPAGVSIQTSNTLRILDSTAVIPIKGVLMRRLPAALAWWGIQGTSYEDIADQIQAALADPAVKSIRLEVDSPGGTVPGVLETAELIRQARQTKPVTAVVDDLAASGAYWLASQASEMISVRNGMIGSIGVFCVYRDSSKMYEKVGVKVIVIRSGDHKGMGVPGAEITEKQIAGTQELIDGIADNFIEAVALGREVSTKTVKKWATGQLWLAEQARELGLIDGIIKADEKVSNSKENKMKNELTDKEIDAQISENDRQIAQAETRASEQAKAGERARLAALKMEFPENLEYALQAFESGLSVEQAKAGYCDILREKIKETSAAQAAAAQAAAEQAAAGGQAEAMAVGDTEPESGDFIAEARELACEQKITLTAAMRKLMRTSPGSYQKFLERCKTDGHAMYQQAV